jgi:hypothetical protein
MRVNLRPAVSALIATGLLTAALLPASTSFLHAAPSYDDDRCRGYADSGDHQRAAECYYNSGEAKAGPYGTGDDRYEVALELMQFSEQEARAAGDLFLAAQAIHYQANLNGFRLKRPAEGTALGEKAALLFLQIDPNTEFNDAVLRVRHQRLHAYVGFSYNAAGQYAKDAGDYERSVAMYLAGARSTAQSYLPAAQAAADLISAASNGVQIEAGNPGQPGLYYGLAVEAAGKAEDPALVVEILREYLDLSLDMLSAGFEKLKYGFDNSVQTGAVSTAVGADLSLVRSVEDTLGDAYEYAVAGGAAGATSRGRFEILEGLIATYALLAQSAQNSHSEYLLASRLYEMNGDAHAAFHEVVDAPVHELQRAAISYDIAAKAARRGGDLVRAEELWVKGAETFEQHLEVEGIDRSTVTLSYAKLDAVYYGEAGRAAQDRGDCSRAGLWFRKQAETLALHDGQSHEPKTCVPPANPPTPVSDGQPSPTPAAQPTAPSQSTGLQPSNPDAALEDLLNTFGRMTREVAEERIKVEIKGNLDDLAAWLGEQLESYLSDSADFLDELYGSLPEFVWEEQEEAGDIPSEVDEQPDDPGGPGISASDLIDVMSKKVQIPTNLDVESGEELYELVRDMLWQEDPDSGRFTRTRAAGGEVIELKRRDGSTVKAGVFVTPDGRVLYSTDGTNFYPDISDAIDPSLGTRGLETYQAVRSHVWQRLFEGQLRDGTQQLINEVSQEVLDEFRREISASSASSAPEDVYDEVKNPFNDIEEIGKDPYLALEGKATKSANDYLEGKLWDPVKEKLKEQRDAWLWAAAEKALDNSIEFEARQHFKFLLKEYQDLGNDALAAWEDMRKKAGLDLFELTGVSKKAAASGEFMVSAVNEMGKGLQDSDFGVRAQAYIQLRQQGQSPETLWDETRAGNVPELEFSTGRVTRSGTESVMAQQGIPPEVHLGLSFSLYEQAYQRFLLAQQLGRKP